MANRRRGLKPAETAAASWQYQETWPRGGKGREVTTVKDEKLSPSTKSGNPYNLVAPSKKPGRGKQSE